MVRKLSIALLCLLLTGVAAVAVVLGISSSNKGSGSQINNADPTGSTSGSGSSSNGGSTDGSSSSNNSSGSSNGGTVAAHTCEFVYYSTIPATCTAQGYDLYICSVYSNCPQTDKRNTKKVLGHDYKYTQHDATCTSDWSQTGVCSRCGDIDSQTVSGSAKPHDYDWVVTLAADCITDGSKIGTCKGCGVTFNATIPALGHSYGAYISNGNATCTADGTETSECSNCHDKLTRTAVGSSLGHSYGKYVVITPRSCTQDEISEATCSVCRTTDTKVTAKEGHIFSKTWIIVTEATCEHEGYKTHKCTECGEKIGVTIPKLSHTFSGGKCTGCGENLQVKKGTFTHDVTEIDGTVVSDFGTITLEFEYILYELDSTMGSGHHLYYNFTIIQTYTLNGKKKVEKHNVVDNDDVDTHASFGDGAGVLQSFQLYSLKENRYIDIYSWIDYFVNINDGWMFFTFGIRDSYTGFTYDSWGQYYLGI